MDPKKSKCNYFPVWLCIPGTGNGEQGVTASVKTRFLEDSWSLSPEAS